MRDLNDNLRCCVHKRKLCACAVRDRDRFDDRDRRSEFSRKFGSEVVEPPFCLPLEKDKYHLT